METLDYISKDFCRLLKLKALTKKDIEIPVSITLSCRCCTEYYTFYAHFEDIVNWSDREILHSLEEQCDIYLDHISYFSYEDDTITIELN
jgi:hypothetical protein